MGTPIKQRLRTEQPKLNLVVRKLYEKDLEPRALEYADEPTALKQQVLAILQGLDTGGPVDQFQRTVRVELRSQPPNPHLVNVVRALGGAVAAIDTYLQS